MRRLRPGCMESAIRTMGLHAPEAIRRLVELGLKRAEMSPTQRTIRIQVMVDSEEIKAIDDWRFEKRLPSRAAAVREIIRRGLLTPDREDNTVQMSRVELGLKKGKR